jgi:ubiquinone/menaquinone biosynthesis C-methylase UbiE
MAQQVCPWWLGYFLLTPVRRWWQDPAKILREHVASGMTAVEVGPGMGYFTLELARLVGPHGRVIAVDIQPRMLAGLRRRAERAGLTRRIETRQATSSGLGIGDLAGKVGFVLAFAVIHELPDAVSFFAEVAPTLTPAGRVLVAEPRGHISEAAFAVTLEQAAAAGFRVTYRPAIARSHTAVLVPQ